MATRTEYVVPTSPTTVAVTPGTATRQWMSPQGSMLNEVISTTPPGGSRPVVQVSG